MKRIRNLRVLLLKCPTTFGHDCSYMSKMDALSLSTFLSSFEALQKLFNENHKK